MAENKEKYKYLIKKQGITLIALVITIVILLILAGVGISVGKDTIESAKLMSYGTELQAMQNKVNELEQELQRKVKSNDNDEVNRIKNIGQNLQGSEQETLAFSGAEISDTSGYRYYDKNTVEDLGLKNFNSEFLVNVEKRKVISLYGINYRGKTIWTVEQLDGNEQYNVEYAGVNSIATFDLFAYGNKIYVSNINYVGNVKKGTIYYAQDSSGEKDWKVVKSNTTESNCTIEVMADGTFWVKIKDSAGNESQEKSIYVKDVIGKRASAVLKTDKNGTDSFKKSPYVEYDGNLYRVLYDSTLEYGVELISNSTIGDMVKLGKNDPAGNGVSGAGTLGSNDRAIWSYTNAIETLNKAAESRVKKDSSIIADVRCVGSRPGNKNFKITDKYTNELTYDTNPYFSEEPHNYNGLWEQGEGIFDGQKRIMVTSNDNYTSDFLRMTSLGINKVENDYWVASRRIRVYSNETIFDLPHISAEGTEAGYLLFRVYSSGEIASLDVAYYIRPILHLSPGVKIMGGEGTETSPYTLGL